MTDFVIVNGKLTEYKGNQEIVEIPSQVTRIGHNAFKGKSTLKGVIIPKGVEAIDSGAFENCPVLEEIFIPTGVTRIEDQFAENCPSLRAINVDKDNMSFMSLDGVIYRNSDKSLLLYPPKKQGEVFEIPQLVKGLAPFAFSNSHLKKIIIGDYVEIIDEGVFDFCPFLEEIQVSSKNQHHKSINGCLYSKNGDILERYIDKFGKDLVINEDVQIIGEHACQGCESLENAKIPDGVLEIGGVAFFSCPNLKSVEIPEGVVTIGYSAFCNCKSLASVILPSTLEEIIGFAFSNCPSLEKLEIPASVKLMDFGVFHNSKTTLLVKKGSYAHTYAVQKELKCILI
ncbi:MAG: leucine-rich repeat domain-containing protein [Clostridia bacterium]|nr:leucine-rich repeat domain-containing protein [Clostridia bacterium]